jgi:hypothetical protein
MLVIVDIDLTIADARPRLEKAGKMPHRTHPHFQRWLDTLQPKGALEKDPPIPVMCDLVAFLAYPANIVYLTGRDSQYKDETENWLDFHCLPKGDLYMRPHGNKQSAKAYKETIVKKLKKKYGIGIAIDDDIEGDCGEMYRKHGFVHLKVLLPEVK